MMYRSGNIAGIRNALHAIWIMTLQKMDVMNECSFSTFSYRSCAFGEFSHPKRNWINIKFSFGIIWRKSVFKAKAGQMLCPNRQWHQGNNRQILAKKPTKFDDSDKNLLSFGSVMSLSFKSYVRFVTMSCKRSSVEIINRLFVVNEI